MKGCDISLLHIELFLHLSRILLVATGLATIYISTRTLLTRAPILSFQAFLNQTESDPEQHRIRGKHSLSGSHSRRPSCLQLKDTDSGEKSTSSIPHSLSDSDSIRECHEGCSMMLSICPLCVHLFLISLHSLNPR